MKRNSWFIISAIAVLFFITPPASAELTELGRDFSDALIINDTQKMNRLVITNKAEIPREVENILRAARLRGVSIEDKEALFHMGEKMARSYMENFGESALLKDVKRNRFESRLGELTETESLGGAHIIKIPLSNQAGPSHLFKPDNLLIKKGESVVWVNEDTHSHVFASMAVIGEGGIFAPSIEPGGSWKYRFKRAGEYYYICFIHKGMIGKITVK